MNIAIIPSKIFQDMIFQLIAPFSDLISWVVEHMSTTTIIILIIISIFIIIITIFQLIAPFSDLISWVVEHMGSGEFLPSNWLMDWLAAFVCDVDNPLGTVVQSQIQTSIH